MPPSLKKDLETFLKVCEAIIDTVRETDGASSNVIYAAMIPYGVTLETYNKLIALLIGAGKLERHGQYLNIPQSH